MGITKEVLLNRLNSTLKGKFELTTSSEGNSYRSLNVGYRQVFNDIIECDSIGVDLKKTAKHMLFDVRDNSIEGLLKRLQRCKARFEVSLNQDNSGLTSEERETVMAVYNKLEHKLDKMEMLRNKNLVEFANDLRQLKDLCAKSSSFDDLYSACNTITDFLSVLRAWLSRCQPGNDNCFNYDEVEPETLKMVKKECDKVSSYYSKLWNDGDCNLDEEFCEKQGMELSDALGEISEEFLEFLDYLKKEVFNKIKDPKNCYPIHSIQKAIAQFCKTLNEALNAN